jgi:hypothetical protein
MKFRVFFAFFAAVVGMLAFANAGAEPVFLKGMRVGLEPPGELRPSARFAGFEDVLRGVTISILQLQPGAYQEIQRSIFAKNQAGLTGIKRESFPFASGIGVLISGEETVNGVKIRKWFLAASGVGSEFGDLLILIKVEVPDAASAVYSDEAIRKALASVTFRSPPIEEQLGLLPFKIEVLSGFRVMQVLPGNGAILIDGPSKDMVANPYVIVSVGRGAPDRMEYRARFARDLLMSAPLRDIALTSAEPLRIDGRPGYEVRATATGLDGKELALVQWLRFGKGSFIRIVGVAPKDKWDQLLPRFRAVRDGIDLGNGG